MKELSPNSYSMPVEIESSFTDGYVIGIINYRLTMRRKVDQDEIFRMSNKSFTKLRNKLSGTYGIKAHHICIHSEEFKYNGEMFYRPYKAVVSTDLKAERRIKIRGILGEHDHETELK